MMKLLQHFFLVVLLFATTMSYSQEEEKMKKEKPEFKKHEIRIIMENFFGNKGALDNYQIWNSANFSNTGTYEFYNNRFIYGLGYNFNFKNFGIRTKGFYSNYDETYFDSWKQENISSAELLRLTLGLNYQKHFENVTLFFGIDISYFKINLEQILLSTNPSSYPDTHQYTNYKGTGIEPLVGFKYFISEYFSFSSEIRFIRDAYKGNTLITYSNSFGGLPPDYEIDFEGSHSKLGPNGSISLNVHF